MDKGKRFLLKGGVTAVLAALAGCAAEDSPTNPLASLEKLDEIISETVQNYMGLCKVLENGSEPEQTVREYMGELLVNLKGLPEQLRDRYRYEVGCLQGYLGCDKEG
jgi:hypothetical protein